MTHKSIPEKKRQATGIQSSLIRFSFGIEHAADLIKDLEQPFVKIKKKELV
ncbi:MAG: PLP-dependent transferase [Flavobacteriales bacterium Tduv]